MGDFIKLKIKYIVESTRLLTEQEFYDSHINVNPGYIISYAPNLDSELNATTMIRIAGMTGDIMVEHSEEEFEKILSEHTKKDK
jgi:hypothetical protein